MRTRVFLLAILACPLLLGSVARAADHPLTGARIVMSDGSSPAKRKILFKARWQGSLDPMPNPTFDPSSLRVSGANGSGDSGLIRLVGAAWKSKKKSLIYSEKSGSAGGIRSIVLKATKSGGKLKIAGGAANWAYRLDKASTTSTVTVLLRLGNDQFYAEFPNPKVKGKKLVGISNTAPSQPPCAGYDSTFQAIQAQIFDRHGCTSSACHGSDPDPTRNGTLDLRPANAYADLFRVPSHASADVLRVAPGGKQDSLLWQKLAAGRGEWNLNGLGSPMPLALDPISEDELTAVGKWIHDGASQTDIVDGTADLLGSCLPPAAPPTDTPLPAPAKTDGVQFHAPPWSIQPAGAGFPPGLDYGDNGEDEVCYATYFDLTKDPAYASRLVDCPDFWKTKTNPSGKCWYFNRDELKQSADSHHSIIHMYRGNQDVTERSQTNPDRWFDFQCHDGEMPTGVNCDPRVDGACPAGQVCRGKVKSSLACLTYGPADFGFSLNGAGTQNAPAIGGSQQPYLDRRSPVGVYGVFPAQGVIVWNSHAFDVWKQPVQNQQWFNIYFVPDYATIDPTKIQRGIFDATDIFVENVPPFERREYCRTITFQKGTRIFDVSSHNHKRGVLFRIFPPPIAQSCSSAHGVCEPEQTTPILTSTQYNDPAQVHPDPPIALDSDDPAQRRMKFCSVYDNGQTDPSAVKRNSTSPVPPSFGNLAPGGPCNYLGLDGKQVDNGIACVAGPNKGKPCADAVSKLPNDHACDSAAGANDGLCDACPVTGGVTTEDEMFIMLGTYYCDATVPGQTCTTEDYTN